MTAHLNDARLDPSKKMDLLYTTASANDNQTFPALAPIFLISCLTPDADLLPMQTSLYTLGKTFSRGKLCPPLCQFI